jgi:hypothetical protein
MQDLYTPVAQARVRRRTDAWGEPSRDSSGAFTVHEATPAGVEPSDAEVSSDSAGDVAHKTPSLMAVVHTAAKVKSNSWIAATAR